MSETAPVPDLAPSPQLAADANGQPELFEEATADLEGFWARQARERLTWDTDFEQVLDWSEAPFAKWFVGGRLNVAHNCVDRHVEAGNGERVAIHFEGERGDTRTLTYADLQREVAKAANALTELGVQTGDRVAIYLPMIPEAIVTMLACARLGAPHSVVFGGFSADALKSRILDAQARVVVTADGQFRKGTSLPLKKAVDEAIDHMGADSPVDHVLVVHVAELGLVGLVAIADPQRLPDRGQVALAPEILQRLVDLALLAFFIGHLARQPHLSEVFHARQGVDLALLVLDPGSLAFFALTGPAFFAFLIHRKPPIGRNTWRRDFVPSTGHWR